MPDGLDSYLDSFKKKPATKDTVARVLDDEFAKLGYGDNARLSILGDVGRENNWDRNTIFKGHFDPKNKAYNRGIISWQGNRQSNLQNFLKKEGVLGRGDDDELRAMARFMDSELQTPEFASVRKKLLNAKNTYEASEALRQYIKYVPDAPYNTPDPNFRVKNNAIWANRAKRLGLGSGSLDRYLDQFKNAGQTADALDGYLDQFKQQSIPEPAQTITLQREAAANPKVKSRTGVLLNKGDVPDPAEWEGFSQHETPDGRPMMVHGESAAKNLRLKTPDDVDTFVKKNPAAIERMVGIIDSVDNTGGGQPVVTAQVDGKEAASAVVTDEEKAQHQADVYREQFPQAEIGVTTTDDIAGQRVNELSAIGEAAKAGQRFGQQVPSRGQASIPRRTEIQSAAPALDKSAFTDKDFRAWAEYNNVAPTNENRKRFSAELQKSSEFGSSVEASVNPSDFKIDGEPVTAFSLGTTVKGGQLGAGQREPGKTTDDLNRVINSFAPTTAKDDRDAAIQALVAVGRNWDITEQEAAKYVDSLRSPLAIKGWQAGDEIQITYKDIAKIRGEDAVKTDIAIEQAQNRDTRPDLRLKKPSNLNEFDSEKALEQRIKQPGYSAQQIGSDAINELFTAPLTAAQKAGWAFGTWWHGDKLPEPSQESIEAEKDRLLKQYGSYAKAYDAEKYFQDMTWGETAVRMARQTAGSFAKNLISGTGKSIAFAGQLAEDINPVNLLLPDEAKIGVRNAVNIADFLVRLMQTDSKTAWKETDWATSDDISKQQIFRAMQEFDKAIGDDPVLKHRFLGSLSDASGSALSFVALGALMPSMPARLLGKTRDFSLAVSGAAQMAGTGYEEGKREGLSESQAKAFGVIQGLLGTTEMVGAGAELAQLLKTPTLRRQFANALLEVGKTVKREAQQEFGQEVFQTTSGKAVMAYLKDTDPSTLTRLTNALNRLPKQIAETVSNEGLIAIITGGAMGGATAAATVATAPKTPSETTKLAEDVPQIIDTKAERVDVVDAPDIFKDLGKNEKGEATYKGETLKDIEERRDFPNRLQNLAPVNLRNLAKSKGIEVADNAFEGLSEGERREIAVSMYNDTFQPKGKDAVPEPQEKGFEVVEKEKSIDTKETDADGVDTSEPKTPEFNSGLKKIIKGEPFSYKGLDGQEYAIRYKDFDYQITKNNRKVKTISPEQAEQIIFSVRARDLPPVETTGEVGNDAKVVRSRPRLSQTERAKIVKGAAKRGLSEEQGNKIADAYVGTISLGKPAPQEPQAKTPPLQTEAKVSTPESELVLPEPLTVPKEYGSDNTKFTRDKAESAKALLLKKFGKDQTKFGAGLPDLDAETIKALKDLAGFHLEAGVKKLTELADRVVAEVGEWARPYIEKLYAGMDDKNVEQPKIKERKTIKTAHEYGLLNKNKTAGEVRYYEKKSNEPIERAAQNYVEKVGFQNAFNEAILPSNERNLDREARQMAVVQLLNNASMAALNKGDAQLSDYYEEQTQAVFRALAPEATEAGQFIQLLSRWKITNPATVLARVKLDRKQNGLDAAIPAEQRKALVDEATKLEDAQKQIDDLMARLSESEADRAGMKTRAETAETKIESLRPFIEKAEKFVREVDKRADAARERIKARGNVFSAGLDPFVLKDFADIAASHIAHLGLDFAKVSDAMITEFGEKIKPHLNEIWKKARGLHEDSEDAGLKAAKTRLRNQITSLEEQIRTRTRKTSERKTVEYDAEAKALIDKRNDLKVQFEELFGKPGMSDVARLKAYKTRTENRIIELTKQLEEHQFRTKPKRPGITLDQEAQAMKAELDALKGKVNEAVKDEKKASKQEAFAAKAKELKPNVDEAILDGALARHDGATSFDEITGILRQKYPDRFKPDRGDAAEQRKNKQRDLINVIAESVKLYQQVNKAQFAERQAKRDASKGIDAETRKALEQAKRVRAETTKSLTKLVQQATRPPGGILHTAAQISRASKVALIQTAATNVISTKVEQTLVNKPIDTMDIALQRIFKGLKNEGLDKDASVATAWWTPKAKETVYDEGMAEYSKGLSKHEILLKVIDEHPEYFAKFFGDFSPDFHTGVSKTLDKVMIPMRIQEFFMRDSAAVKALAQRASMKGLDFKKIIESGDYSSFTKADLDFALTEALSLTYALKPKRGGGITDTTFATINSAIRSSGMLDLMGSESAPFINFMYNTINKYKTKLPGVAQIRLVGKTVSEAKRLKLEGETPDYIKEAVRNKWTSRQIANQMFGVITFAAAIAMVRGLGDKDEWYKLKIPFTTGYGEKTEQYPDGEPMYFDVRTQPLFAPFVFVANKMNRLAKGKDMFTYGDHIDELTEAFLGTSYRSTFDQNAGFQTIKYAGKTALDTVKGGDDTERNAERLSLFARKWLGNELGTLTNFLQFKTFKDIAAQFDTQEQYPLNLDNAPFTEGIDRRLPESKRILRDVIKMEVESRKNFATDKETSRNPVPALKVLGFNIVDGATLKPEPTQAEILARKLSYGSSTYKRPELPDEKRDAAIKRDFRKAGEKLQPKTPEAEALKAKLKTFDTDLTAGQIGYATRTLFTSDLEDNFKGLSAKKGDASAVWEAATDAERVKLKPLYEEKLTNILKDKKATATERAFAQKQIDKYGLQQQANPKPKAPSKGGAVQNTPSDPKKSGFEKSKPGFEGGFSGKKAVDVPQKILDRASWAWQPSEMPELPPLKPRGIMRSPMWTYRQSNNIIDRRDEGFSLQKKNFLDAINPFEDKRKSDAEMNKILNDVRGQKFTPKEKAEAINRIDFLKEEITRTWVNDPAKAARMRHKLEQYKRVLK